MAVVRRYPLIAFFVLAYAFSWWPWPLYALDLIPGYIVGFGPFLAALVVAIANGPEHLSRKRAAGGCQANASRGLSRSSTTTALGRLRTSSQLLRTP
jgi:hypothetical protein